MLLAVHNLHDGMDSFFMPLGVIKEDVKDSRGSLYFLVRHLGENLTGVIYPGLLLQLSKSGL
jgi:hypothetical protein